MSKDTGSRHGGTPLPPSGEPDLGALVDRVKRDAKAWVEAEKAYVSAEISGRIEMAAQPAISFAAAGFLGFLASIAFTVALALGLGLLVGAPLGFLIVTLLYLGGAYLLYVRGRARMKRMLRMQVSKRAAAPEADWAPERGGAE
ncbi:MULTISPECIES: phage holin family protein [Pacificimonas]|uniref:Phage holin family protein n=1 Tax=Pacificimonas aurantium TaxID=1250540 RepID=A0ABS7WNJ9_9SPHN|nr:MULTISPECIES: phage holin family protein [Pacificimonas]MBZ6379971.1 phage holin family protein [Pacificimonas aurantium]